MKKILQVTCAVSVLLMSASIQADVNSDLLDAATRGDVAAVRRALAGKADINARGAKGRTALMWAADKGKLDVVKYLAKKGVADSNAKDDKSMTALMLAAYHGHTDVVKFLVETAGADINVRGPFGKTALGLANYNGNKEIVTHLKQHGAR